MKHCISNPCLCFTGSSFCEISRASICSPNKNSVPGRRTEFVLNTRNGKLNLKNIFCLEETTGESLETEIQLQHRFTEASTWGRRPGWCPSRLTDWHQDSQSVYDGQSDWHGDVDWNNSPHCYVSAKHRKYLGIKLWFIKTNHRYTQLLMINCHCNSKRLIMIVWWLFTYFDPERPCW